MSTTLKFIIAALLFVGIVAGVLYATNPAKPKPPIPVLPHKPHIKEKAARIEVLDFYATWCIPCRRNAPAVDLLMSQGHKITKVDIDDQPALKEKYEITSVPTYVVLKRGKEVWRTQNVQELRRYLNQRLWHNQRPDRDKDRDHKKAAVDPMRGINNGPTVPK